MIEKFSNMHLLANFFVLITSILNNDNGNKINGILKFIEKLDYKYKNMFSGALHNMFKI